MCGLTGACWTRAACPLTRDELARMTRVLAHRGPDASGTYFSPEPGGPASVALGHRRLSIIDIEGSSQPLSIEDGRLTIVFNGEIYNYRELRRQLQSEGCRLRTEGDTEPILHLYRKHGEDCLRHLRGMFAFAIWDEPAGKLFLARDRLGQKPLFYRHEPGRLLFASELKSLLLADGAPRELDPEALDLFVMYQYVPHPRTMLAGYHKLPPAHYALWQDGSLRLERYWTPPFAPPVTDGPSGDEARELRALLTEAVRLRLRSDVPLGAFLSGGIDSTIIAGLMQQEAGQRIKTFSIGFPQERFDERRFARRAAEHLGTEHHEEIVEPSAVDILPRLIWHYDEPFADSSAIPTMYLSEMTRKHVTVALSGDGGDELFAGYDRYRAVALAQRIDRLPRPLRAILTSPFWQKLPASLEQKSLRRRAKRFLAMLGESPERRYANWVSIFDESRRRDLYADGFREKLGLFDAFSLLEDAYAACPNRDFVTRTTCVDLLTYLPCDILTKVDVASMAASLECRSPFLDHEVVEFAARLPIRAKLRGRRGKRILTETFRDLLPAEIQRRPKMGFGVPLDHWFRGELKPLVHDTLLSQRSLERGYFNPSMVRQLVEEHADEKWDHSARLWALLCFELWQQTFLDSPNVPDAPRSA